jgi:uncharacterized protein YbjT (DUF2867 family)
LILVTAANGNQGKLLIPRLLAAGVAVRACVRSNGSARTLSAAGVTDIVIGDMSDPGVLAQAMDGVKKVYYVGPALHPKEREMGIAAIDAARRAGVRHFVFSSVLHAIITDLVQHEIKRDIEEHLISSGLEFTIFQPANYTLDRRQSLVDLGDVTEVAAAVLASSEKHAGATYELVAPGRYTAHELAKIISGVAGREVIAEQIDSETFLKASLGADSPTQFPYQARLLRAISNRYSRHDFIGNPNVLTWLLGREPTTFEQFAQRTFDAREKDQR